MVLDLVEAAQDSAEPEVQLPAGAVRFHPAEAGSAAEVAGNGGTLSPAD